MYMNIDSYMLYMTVYHAMLYQYTPIYSVTM